MGCFTRCWVTKCDLEPFVGTESLKDFKHLELEENIKEHLKVALTQAKVGSLRGVFVYRNSCIKTMQYYVTVIARK